METGYYPSWGRVAISPNDFYYNTQVTHGPVDDFYYYLINDISLMLDDGNDYHYHYHTYNYSDIMVGGNPPPGVPEPSGLLIFGVLAIILFIRYTGRENNSK